MRVLYDGIVFQNSYQRGIQRAFREVIDHMPLGVEMTLALSDRAKCDLPRRARVARTVPGIVGFLHRRIRRAIVPRLSAPALKKLSAGFDVFHSTYYTLPPRDMPTVLHVHDLIPERFPELFKEPWAAKEIEQRRIAIEQATRIICISEATRQDVIQRYPAAEAKTAAVYFGCDHLLRAAGGSAEAAEPGPDALFVGDRGGYKNFAMILDAMATPEWPAEIGLVVAGRAWTDEEGVRVQRLAANRRIHHAGRPSDAELARLYARARCVIVPSLAEGFGFPVLEGQASGVPVVCSDIPVFREVVAGGAIYFDGSKPGSLASAVGRTLDPSVRAEVLNVARDNLRRFSWERCAEQVAAAYARAIG